MAPPCAVTISLVMARPKRAPVLVEREASRRKNFSKIISQERPDHRLKALRLVVLKPVTRVLYLFDTEARVEMLQFARRCKGNNAVIPDNKQDGDGNGAHQPVIVRVGRGKNVKGTEWRFHSGRGYELEQLGA